MINKNIKLNILYKIIGKRFIIINDYKNLDYWYGNITEVINQDTVKAVNPEGEIKEVSIFDLRNPSQEI